MKSNLSTIIMILLLCLSGCISRDKPIKDVYNLALEISNKSYGKDSNEYKKLLGKLKRSYKNLNELQREKLVRSHKDILMLLTKNPIISDSKDIIAMLIDDTDDKDIDSGNVLLNLTDPKRVSDDNNFLASIINLLLDNKSEWVDLPYEHLETLLTKAGIAGDEEKLAVYYTELIDHNKQEMIAKFSLNHNSSITQAAYKSAYEINDDEKRKASSDSLLKEAIKEDIEAIKTKKTNTDADHVIGVLNNFLPKEAVTKRDQSPLVDVAKALGGDITADEHKKYFSQVAKELKNKISDEEWPNYIVSSVDEIKKITKQNDDDIRSILKLGDAEAIWQVIKDKDFAQINDKLNEDVLSLDDDEEKKQILLDLLTRQPEEENKSLLTLIISNPIDQQVIDLFSEIFSPLSDEAKIISLSILPNSAIYELFRADRVGDDEDLLSDIRNSVTKIVPTDQAMSFIVDKVWADVLKNNLVRSDSISMQIITGIASLPDESNAFKHSFFLKLINKENNKNNFMHYLAKVGIKSHEYIWQSIKSSLLTLDDEERNLLVNDADENNDTILSLLLSNEQDVVSIIDIVLEINLDLDVLIDKIITKLSLDAEHKENSFALLRKLADENIRDDKLLSIDKKIVSQAMWQAVDKYSKDNIRAVLNAFIDPKMQTSSNDDVGYKIDNSEQSIPRTALAVMLHRAKKENLKEIIGIFKDYFNIDDQNTESWENYINKKINNKGDSAHDTVDKKVNYKSKKRRPVNIDSYFYNR